MKYFYFDDYLESEKLQPLMDFLNLDGEKVLYFRTGGGEYPIAKALVDIINRQKDALTLVGNGKLYSGGFWVFYHAKCKKYLIPGTVGMWHQPTNKITINGNGRPNSTYDLNLKRGNKTSYKLADDMMRDLPFTKKEKKKYRKNYDIYFTWKRMKKLFNQ